MQRNATVLLITIVTLLSCKGKYYRASASNMEATLETGSRFLVTKSDRFDRNDIVVFEHYGDDYQAAPDENGNWPQHWETRVSRLIAISGDTLLIRNGDVYVNGILVPLPEKAVSEYMLWANRPIDDLPSRGGEYYRTIVEQDGDSICYQALLTEAEAGIFESRTGINRFEKIIDTPTNTPTYLFASYGDTCKWSIDNYGPVMIPVVGATVKIDDNNFSLYKGIQGIDKGDYLIKEKLYFVLGDNRHMSQDSRFTGFISHSNMKGIVK